MLAISLIILLITIYLFYSKTPISSGKLYSSNLIPIFSLLLLNDGILGLDSRPNNTTCLAENISPDVELNNAFPGLNFDQPLVLKQPPSDDNRFMIIEKPGVIQLLVNGIKQPQPFLDITNQISSTGERGLLGMTFHPNYSSNRYFYVSYTNNSGNSVISRFSRLSNNANRADVNSEQVILTLDQPFSNHNGGQIEFGPDDYLYISFGDGGSGGDPQDHGQDLSTWLGALLRIDVNNGTPYSIPADNPFANQSCNQLSRTGTCPEIYAYGLRNPWRWSFDSVTQNIWLGDVGQNQFEEINLVKKGDNLGWRCFEGTSVFNSSGCSSIQAVEPVAKYTHSQGRCSITGGYVYRGSIQSLEQIYFYADYCSGEIWGMPVSDPDSAIPMVLTNAGANVLSFAQDNSNNLYVLKSNGVISLIEEGLIDNPDPIPDKLSETGCVDATDISQPASGLIPYDINAPFWSDGAVKSRWMALPNNRRINNSDDNWQFPAGTVLMKKFELNNKPIETRLFKRHLNGQWAGYTYEWNDAETEATRVVGGKTKTVSNGASTQQWVYPSETECLACHTSAANYSLGLESAQLNKPYLYPQNGIEADQLETLAHINIFSHSIGSAASRPKIQNPYDSSQDLSERSRAWLHTNCSSCHRPGSGNSTMDLRYTTIFSATNTCNQEPINGDWGLTDPKLIMPGDFNRSLVHFRANSRDPVIQMPPLATRIEDSLGMSLLSQWINNLTNCN